MKLKNYFLCAAAISFLFSCSDNEPILNNPEEAATTLSLVTSELQTKAEDQSIANLVVAIYSTDGTIVKAVSSLKAPSDNGSGESDDIAISPGNHKVLVLANVSLDKVNKINLDVLLEEEFLTLDGETEGNLTMSSKVMDVTFLPNVRNLMGYPTGTAVAGKSVVVYQEGADTDPAIKLYRHISMVQLLGIELVEETSYGTAISFDLEEVFMANVKSQSRMVADGANTKRSVEVDIAAGAANESSFWWYGNVEGEVGYYKTIKNGTPKPDLLSSGEIKDVQIEAGEWYNGTDDTDNLVAGPFKVYENEMANGDAKVGYQTLLVVKGTYTYKPNDGEGTEVLKDRYYAVPINYAGVKADDKNKVLRDHFGIIRNNIYTMTIGISGPGSENPYQPDAYINVNAEVQVADWTQVTIGGELN